MISRRVLIALLAVLCLVGAQQAAFAHWAAHLGAPAAVGLESAAGEHAAAAALAQPCAGCAALAGIDAAPAAALSFSFAAAPIAAPFVPVRVAAGRPAPSPYASRAPPAVL